MPAEDHAADTDADTPDDLTAWAAAVPVAEPGDKVDAVRARLAVGGFDRVTEIVVCVDGRPVGMVPIEAVLAAAADTAIGDLVLHAPVCVTPEVDDEEAAWAMVRADVRSLAVVDVDGRLIGLLPARRMLAVLAQAHDEDLARLSGLMATSQEARIASEERVGRRLLHRLPWLAIGLLGSMVSVWVVGRAEAELSRVVQLAFFLPAIVYMADAVGTQTETLMIRGMSVGVEVRRILGRELASGLLIGAAIGAAMWPVARLASGDPRIAMVVGLAMFASCAVATTVALVLPWALERSRIDPAFGAGPLSTVVQDLLSIVIYLGLAVALL